MDQRATHQRFFLSLLFLLLFSPSLSLISLFFVSVALLLVPRESRNVWNGVYRREN